MNHYKSTHVVLVVVLIVQLFLFSPAYAWFSNPRSVARAHSYDRNAPDCLALDIVFVIDQSGSMSGHGSAERNDPEGQRFYAVRYALDWLANNRLSKLGICPDVIHRIGMVSFGTQAQIDLPLTEIAPGSQDDWDSQIPGLLQQIQERDMGSTDHAKAFAKAKELLNVDPLGEIPRKRAIILVTDGQPCTTALGCINNEYVSPTQELQEYMSQLENQAKSDFPFSEAVVKRDNAIKAAAEQYGGLNKIPVEVRNQIFIDFPVTNEEYYHSIYLWILATNDATVYAPFVGESFSKIATLHQGDLVDLGQSTLAVPNIFNSIISELLSVKPETFSCGNLAVDPYLSGVVLDIYKAASGLEVEIMFGDKRLTNGEGDKTFFGLEQYSQYGAVEHYRFKNPPAGLWKIVCSSPDDAECSYLPFDALAKLQQPANVLPQYNVNDASYDSAHPFYLAYKIIDQSEGTPLNLDPNYPLDLKAEVKDPTGSTYSLQLQFDENGRWVSQEPLRVNLVGKYEISLTGYAECVVDPDRLERCASPNIKVVRASGDQYEVAAVDLFVLNVVTPQAGGTIPLHGDLLPDGLPLEPIQVKVQLTDLDGNPVRAADILSGDPDQAITAQLSIGGQEEKIALIPDPTDSSRFVGSFTSPVMLGQHTLTITMADIFRFEKYRPQENPVSIQFTRRDPFWRDPQFYRFLSSLFVILLGGGLVYLSWLKTFPLKGILDFEKFDSNTQQPIKCQVGLGRGKRSFKLSKNQLPACIRESFRVLRAENQPARGKAPNRQAVVLISLDNRVHKIIDGQQISDKGWTVRYTFGIDAGQKDRFPIWTVLIVAVTALAVAGIFIF